MNIRLFTAQVEDVCFKVGGKYILMDEFRR